MACFSNVLGRACSLNFLVKRMSILEAKWGKQLLWGGWQNLRMQAKVVHPEEQCFNMGTKGMDICMLTQKHMDKIGIHN